MSAPMLLSRATISVSHPNPDLIESDDHLEAMSEDVQLALDTALAAVVELLRERFHGAIVEVV